MVQNGIRSGTKTTYNSAQNRYIKFCAQYNLDMLPITTKNVLLFVTYLHKSKVSHASICVYLSALRSLQVMAGMPEPYLRTPQVKLALKAIANDSAPTKQKMPIDIELLVKILKMLHGQVNGLVWSAMLTLAFFAGLRGSEYTGFWDKGLYRYVKIAQVKFSQSKIGHVMYFQVARTETNIHGHSVPLGCTGKDLCPVCSMSRYLQNRLTSYGSTNDPLFLLHDKKVITKVMVDNKIKDIVKRLGMNPTQYSTHSIRAGAASTAASLGFAEWEIKKLGGWRSSAYRRYIRNMDKHIVHFSARLCEKR